MVGGRQVVPRHRQVGEVVAREVVLADERGEQRVRVALRGEDQLPVLRQREAFGVEAAGRVWTAARLLQRRDGLEVDVARVEARPDVDADV